MSPKAQAVFYLAALVCFLLAAVGEGAGRGAGRLAARVSLVPLGLALWLFPTFWTAVKVGFDL